MVTGESRRGEGATFKWPSHVDIEHAVEALDHEQGLDSRSANGFARVQRVL